jgi:hypothetical protein
MPLFWRVLDDAPLFDTETQPAGAQALPPHTSASGSVASPNVPGRVSILSITDR